MIVGISGKAGSGKDLVANIIQYHTSFGEYISFNDFMNRKPTKGGTPWEIKKFAGKLKSSIEHKFPNHFSEKLWETLGDEYRNEVISFLEMTRRELLINEAMSMRAIHLNYWVEALMQDYREGGVCLGDVEQDKFPSWLITDVRFTNELHSIYDKGGIVLRVERPGIEGIDSVSETELDHLVGTTGFTNTLYNDGTIDHLVKSVKVFMEMHQIK